jgi:uncharacterized membrane protein
MIRAIVFLVSLLSVSIISGVLIALAENPLKMASLIVIAYALIATAIMGLLLYRYNR